MTLQAELFGGPLDGMWAEYEPDPGEPVETLIFPRLKDKSKNPMHWLVYQMDEAGRMQFEGYGLTRPD